MQHPITAHTVPLALRDRVSLFLLVPIAAVVFAVGLDQGELLRTLGAGQTEWLHEFFHDGRHLFGFPCH